MRISDWSSDVCASDLKGRSCVVTAADVQVIEGRPGVVSFAQLFSMAQLPPRESAAGHSERLDVGVMGLAWTILMWEPRSEWSRHFTDTIDLNHVIDRK